MSGTDASSFPPSGSKFPEAPRRFPESGARAVEIISLPPDLRGRDAPLNVAGKILESQREDGTIRIRTDYGDVTVRTRDRSPPPEAGRVVEIEIPAHDSATPERAVLRSESAPVSRRDLDVTENKSTQESPVQAPSHFETFTRNPGEASQNETSHFETSAQDFARPAVRFAPLTPAQVSEALKTADSSFAVVESLVQPLSAAFLPVQSPETALPNVASTPLLIHDNYILYHDVIMLSSIILSGNFSARDAATATPSAPLAGTSALAPSTEKLDRPIDKAHEFRIDPVALRIPLLSHAIPIFHDELHGENNINIYNKIIFYHLNKTENLANPPLFEEQNPGTLNAVPVAFFAPQVQIASPSPARNIVLNQYFDSGPTPEKAPARAGFLTGTILAVSDGGLPIISIDLPDNLYETLFVMHAVTPHSMTGTMVLLAPLTQQGVAENSIIPNAFPDSFETLWQSMIQAAPHVLADGAARLLPSPAAPNMLGPAALLFIAVVRSGDLAGWMGEKATEALRRIGKSDLAARAGRDLSALSGPAHENENGWKSMPLPMVWDGRVHRVALHWRESGGREDSDKEGKNSGKSGARFIFDLNFDRLGPVQLDGLMRGNRLDIALRTTVPLGAAMRQNLSQRYADCIALAGLGGELHFQTAPESWVKIKSHAPSHSAWA